MPGESCEPVAGICTIIYNDLPAVASNERRRKGPAWPGEFWSRNRQANSLELSCGTRWQHSKAMGRLAVGLGSTQYQYRAEVAKLAWQSQQFHPGEHLAHGQSSDHGNKQTSSLTDPSGFQKLARSHKRSMRSQLRLRHPGQMPSV